MMDALDEKYITFTDDKQSLGTQTLPALHPHWKEDIQFVVYRPPPLDVEDHGAIEEWLERSNFIDQDLHALLRLPHDKFWCQVVFDDTLQRCVDSYLKYAPRHYDVVYQLSDEVLQLHNSLHKLFFLTCLRMATHKESKETFITPSVFGDILYENFIFDIPKLMDLCVLYGDDNAPLLSKMVNNIFTQQPKYQDDLRAVVPTILQVFSTILDKCGVKSDSAPSSPQKLSTSASTDLSLTCMALAEFQDLIFYLSDTAQTLQAFLDIYPPAVHAFHEGELTMKLATSYGSLVTELADAIKRRDWEGSNLQSVLHHKLQQAQVCLLKVFRTIVFHTCLKPVLDKQSVEEMEPHVEDYLQVMSALLSEKRFVANLEMLFPFSDNCDLLQQANYPLDPTRIQFIEQGIQEAFQAFYKRGKKKKKNKKDSSIPNKNKDESVENKPQPAQQVVDQTAVGAQAVQRDISPVEMESMITSVKDLLPDLGEGFIELCLEEMDYNIEAVINAVLEDKLPESLVDMDRSLAREKKPSADSEDSLLAQRRNVFDNDEFDVFSRDRVDLTKIHKGKKDKNIDTKSILDDKSSLSKLKPLYDRYGTEFNESMYAAVDEYEDEYDDTYDSHLVGAEDEDSADELTSKRVLEPPSAPSTDEKDSGSISEESDTEESSSRDEFVPNPEKLRERQAARQAQRQAEYERRHARRQAQPRREYDVRGNPRGQGQSSEVLRNRAYKEKNKSSRAHHNRRVLADKKRRV